MAQKAPKNLQCPMPANAKAKQLALSDQRKIWHPFTPIKDWLAEAPLVIRQAQGSYLFDSRGRAYFDGVSSLWVTTHGHSHPTITRAIQRQAARLDHSTLLGLANEPSIALARELLKIAPKGLSKVFYSDNGSTAVEIALKMAYQYFQNIGQPQKKAFITFKEAYHGDTIGSVSLGGMDLFHKIYKPLLFKTIRQASPYGSGDPALSKLALSRLASLLKKRHRKIAAVVLEPLVQGAAGMLLAPSGFLKGVRQLTRRYGVLLICDEVATGFGRTGKMWACDHERVSPDLLACAKGLSGGTLPLAATLTTNKIFNGFKFDYESQKTFFHGHTYTGNPIACAAALANIRLFKTERTLARMQPKIRALTQALKPLQGHPHIKEIRQKGLMLGIELIKDKARGQAYAYGAKIGARVCQLARAYGVILRPLGPVIVLMPPYSATQAELLFLVKVVHACVNRVTLQGRAHG